MSMSMSVLLQATVAHPRRLRSGCRRPKCGQHVLFDAEASGEGPGRIGGQQEVAAGGAMEVSLRHSEFAMETTLPEMQAREGLHTRRHLDDFVCPPETDSESGGDARVMRWEWPKGQSGDAIP